MTKREKMIMGYLPLARRLALRYRGTSQPTEDLIQVASVGLIKAVDRWDPDRGVSFAAFATPTILGELRRHFRDRTWTIRPPRELQELGLAAARARERLDLELGREPSAAEVAARLRRAPSDVARALEAGRLRTLASLDGASDAVGAEDDDYRHAESRATLDRITRILDANARRIVRMHYEDDLPQAEIAARLGVSAMSVSRILRASLERLAAFLTPAAA